jgi:WD40 repeat protein
MRMHTPKRAALIAAMLGLVTALGFRLPVTGQQPQTKADVQGDPLPAGALARLGTVRMRHADMVSLVAFVQGGKTLLTVGQDGTVCEWDLTTGKELRRFKTLSDQQGNGPGGFGRAVMVGGGGGVMFWSGGMPGGLTLSADGKTLAVTGMDGALHLWDTTAGKELRKIDNTHADGGVAETVFSPDGKTLAVRSYDGSMRLFEVATSKKIRQLGKKPDNGNVFYGGGAGLAFSPDGKTVVSTIGQNANGKQVWHLVLHDTGTGKELRRITSEDQNGNPVCPTFAPDGKTLVWSKWDGSVLIADVGTGKVLHEHKGDGQGGSGDFILTPDGKTLISRSMNSALRFLDLASGKATQKFGKPALQNELWGIYGPGSRGGMALLADGKLIAVGGEGHSVRLLDMVSGKERDFGVGHRSTVSRVSYALDGKSTFSHGQDGTLHVWDAATGKHQRQVKLPQGGYNHVLSPDGRILVSVHADNNVRLWDTTTDKELHKLDGAKEGVSSLAFSADGKTVAVYGAAEKGASIWLYDTATGKEKRRIKVPVPMPDNAGGGIPFSPSFSGSAGMSFSPDGRLVSAVIDHHTLGLWETATGKELTPIQSPDQKPIQSAVFTPDSRCLALDLGEDSLRLWEIASGKERRHLGKKPPLAGQPNGGPNGMALAGAVAGAGFGGVSLPYSRPAPTAAFSPDGKLLAHSRSNATVSVWEVATGKEVGQLKGHRGQIETLSFAPDGKTLVTGSHDTTSLIWDVAGLAKSAKSPAAADVNVEARWKDLAGDDAAKAYDAILALAGAPEQARAFLKDRLQPAAAGDASQIAKLITDLDSDQFAVRKKASADLEKIGEPAIPLLRKALEGDPSQEVRKRIEELLAKTSNTAPRGEALRTLRVIEALETMATPEARHVLQALAKGMPEAGVTRAAQAALERLGR